MCGPACSRQDSPPYLHDGRLLTLEDTEEFFNLVLAVKLTPQEKTDLGPFSGLLEVDGPRGGGPLATERYWAPH